MASYQKPCTGSVQAHGGYWHTVINVKIDGVRKAKWMGTGLPERGNKRKAMEILEQRKREYDEHGLTALLGMDDRTATNSMLFSTFMLKWVKTKKPSLRETTYNGYVNSIEGRIKEKMDYCIPILIPAPRSYNNWTSTEKCG